MKQVSNKYPFIAGLDLSESFYHEAVAPIFEAHFPGLEFTAGLIGQGSEVLGFDTKMSMDHHWGPRVMIFLRTKALESLGDKIKSVIANEIPHFFQGIPTHFSEPNPDDNGVQLLCKNTVGLINHRVELLTLDGFFHSYMSINIRKELKITDWLSLPFQKLRSLQSGHLFRDDLDLNSIMACLAWYPYDVWVYILASCWVRIGEEEHLMGRVGSVGDDIGSALIASRLIRDIMRLVFLMERSYPPYLKWFGSAFYKLKSANILTPILAKVINAKTWQERESNLCRAYSIIAEMHNKLGITDPLHTMPSHFHGRPFLVIHGDEFAKALIDKIEDKSIKTIAKEKLIGNIDLISDNTRILEDNNHYTAFWEKWFDSTNM